MRTIREPARDVPVVADVDVVVAGGGPSGFAAAVAAARRGAETLLIEGSGFLGGMFTGSQILTLCGYNCWIEPYERIVTGVGAEMIERAAELGGAEDNNSWVLNIDPEVVKLVLDDMVLGAGAQVLLHSWGVAPYIEGDAVQGMLIENKSGRGVVLAKVVIDATGDGDIAARAGADFRVGEMLQPMSQPLILGNVQGASAEDVARPQPAGYTEPGYPRARRHRSRRMDVLPDEDHMRRAHEAGELPVYGGPWFGGLHPDRVWVNAVRYIGDSTNAEDLTQAEIQGRRDAWALYRYFRAHVPALREATMLTTGPTVGLRESRQIVGDYTLTVEDVQHEARFPDAVALGCWPTDVHPADGSVGPLEMSTLYVPWPYQIPYRTMLPRGVEGLLVTGRCISSTQEAHGSSRVGGTCTALGQAAGTAAALAAQRSITPRELPGVEVRDALLAQGVKLEPESRASARR